MKVTIEPWTPYHESLCWRLHDAYFAARGIAAWSRGEIPHDATTNFGMVTQQARFLLEHVAEVAPPAGPITILEVGAGSGGFAANLFRALATACGDAGRTLHDRLRFVMSDYAARSIAEAAETLALRDLVAAGRVVPAVLDLRGEDPPRDLSGAPIAGPFHAVYANYVCCVIPPRNLQWRGRRWYEQIVEVTTVVPDGVDPDAHQRRVHAELLADPTRENLLRALDLGFDWRDRPLDAVLPDAFHRDVVERLAVGFDDATIGYPLGFVDFLRRLAPTLAPGAVALVTDYGRVDRRDLGGLAEREPQIYGNSFAHEIHFAAFDAFADVAGWQLLRTRDPLRSVHTAALRPDRPFSAAERASFGAHFEAVRIGEDIIDFYDIARRCAEDKDFDRAVRFYQRCVAYDPDNAEYRYRVADTAIDGGHYELAIAAAEAGMVLPGGDEYDFEFILGRAFCLNDDYTAAIAWYERSLDKDLHWVTLTNLATLYEHAGRFEDARRGYLRALDLKPDYEKASQRLSEMARRIH